MLRNRSTMIFWEVFASFFTLAGFCYGPSTRRVGLSNVMKDSCLCLTADVWPVEVEKLDHCMR